MTNEELNEWAAKVRKGKKELDQKMFDEVLKQYFARCARGEDGMEWLRKQYREFSGSNFVGGHLMKSNAKLIYDKAWSLARKREKRS